MEQPHGHTLVITEIPMKRKTKNMWIRVIGVNWEQTEDRFNIRLSLLSRPLVAVYE